MRRAACLLFLFMCATSAKAQRIAEEGLRQPRILLLLDGSSSMLQPWNSTTRFKAAAQVISKLMDSIYAVNAGVEFGLRVYGHQSPSQNNDCFDSRLEVMFSKNNGTQMSLRLASLKPFGVSPIAFSLKEAATNDLVDEVRNAYSVILITDGGESCGGNICEVVKTLIERKIYFRPYILSLVNYAPLKEQYACLGTYLQVATEQDITPAINKIVEAYRPLLSMPIMAVKTEPTPPKPNLKTVTLPAWKPDRSDIAALIPANKRLTSLPVRHWSPVMRRMPIPRIAFVSKPPPEAAPPVIMLSPTVAKRDTTPVKSPPVLKRDTIATVNPAVAKPPVIRRDTPARTTVTIRPIPAPTVTKPKPVPTPPANNKPKETQFTTQTEEAKETSLAILFTDGRGRYYASTPQLQLTDAVTGKLVKQFYRTVDPAGNPDPQIIPAGTYNLLVVGRANMLMRRIVVEPNKKNNITVKVSNGSLIFRYEDAPERPVTEFDAVVNIRFEPGPTVKQKCTAELEYPPGTYFIEVNTLPVTRFSTDIDFGATTQIELPQPGYVQFTNTNAAGNVRLFAPLGNRFVAFYNLRITGHPDDQRLQLRPGAYEVHWVKNPGLPFAEETVEKFNVRSNSVTEVELR